MDNIKNDSYYLKKICEDLAFISQHMSGIGIGDFSENELLQDSMMFRIIQVSENARKLSDKFRESKNNIPWTDIFGLRNRIVHEYGHVNLQIIYDTLTKDIPDLLKSLR